MPIDHDITMYSPTMFYENENVIMMQRYIDYILEHRDNATDFLELGIGRGETVRLLRQHFKELTVLDGEKRLIDQYKDRYPDIVFEHRFFEDYQPQKKFHNIGMGFVLDLVDSPVDLLRQYSDYLSQRGKIYISIENASSLHRLIAYEAGLLTDLNKLSESNEKFGHKIYYTYDEWVHIIEQAGLEIVASHGLFLKPFSTAQLNSLNLEPNVYEALSTTAKHFPKIANACFFVLEKP